MSEEKYSKIIESLAELKGTTSSIRDDLTTIKNDVHQNTIDLEKHIAGVLSNTARLELEKETRNQMLSDHETKSQKRFEELDTRLEIVEFLPNLLKSLRKALIWLGGLAAAGAAISKFIGLW